MDDIDLSDRADAQLDNLIRNHEAQGAAAAPLCLAARAERDLRRGFDADASLALLREAAARGVSVLHGDLARGDGVRWTNVRKQVGAHLQDLAAFAEARGLPMLTALVTDRAGLATGALSPASLKELVQAARAIGRPAPEDPVAFAADERARAIAWAQAEAAAQTGAEASETGANATGPDAAEAADAGPSRAGAATSAG